MRYRASDGGHDGGGDDSTLTIEQVDGKVGGVCLDVLYLVAAEGGEGELLRRLRREM